MKVNTIRLDGGATASLSSGEIDLKSDPSSAIFAKIEAELLAAFEHAAMLGVNVKLAYVPKDFLAASQFAQIARPDHSASAPAVEKHVLIPGFRKIILTAGEKTVGVSSLLPRGPLPIPVEAFLSLDSVDTGDTQVDRWAEVANTLISDEIGSLENAISAIIAMSWFELGVNQSGLKAFVFSEEPKCLIKLLTRAGVDKDVITRTGGPVWILIPPKEVQVRKFLTSVREAFLGVPTLLTPDAIEALVRFRPSILESLSPEKRKQIASLYPRDRAYQHVFSEQFVQSLKQTDRFIINFPARIQWENQFAVTGHALDISESGIRFRTDGAKVPQDAVRDITMKLQVDALQSIQLVGTIRRVSEDGLECGITVNPNSVQFRFLVDWLKRSPFLQKTKG